MNTPITSNFFKKIELHQELFFQDRLFKQSLKDPDLTHHTNSTWEVEKKVLYWTRWGHKHLGSPIVRQRFKQDRDLRDLKMSAKEARVAGIDKTLRNLVQRGYAKYEDPDKKEISGILFSDRGLLMGAVVYETYKPKLITRQKLWKIYKSKSAAETFLSRKSWYWFYRLIIVIGWIIFASGAFLVLQQTVRIIWRLIVG